MKKKLAVPVVVCCALVMLTLACCSQTAANQDSKKSYSEIIGERLVSFTDCANAFSASLEQIADRSYAPSDKQTADIQDKLERLEKACAGLAGLKAPARYAEAQKALDEAMADYADAIDKCSALLEFYGAYDDMFRKYSNPKDGSAEIEKKERALYDSLSAAMQKATDSFRNACEKFDSVKTNNTTTGK